MAQAEALADGSWSAPREAPDVDHDGDMSRLIPEAVLGDREVPYARHATYPALLSVAFVLGGYGAALGLSVIGLWGAAITAGLIARRIDHRLSVPTLWLVGAASPLVFYGYASMAHSLGAACAGTAFLGITQWLDDRRWSPLAYALPALWATVLLRSEGTVYSLAVAAAIGLLALGGFSAIGDSGGAEAASTGEPGQDPAPSRWSSLQERVDRRALLGALVIGASVVATYAVDGRLNALITGRGGYGANPAALAARASADPVSGSWASLLRPSAGDWTVHTTLVLVAVLGLLAASVVLRRPRGTNDEHAGTATSATVALGLMVAAAASSLVLLTQPPSLVTGMLAAFPLMATGLVWMQRSDMEDPLVRRMVLVVILTGAGLVATLYSNGGAAEWGGRFFHVLIPLLAPLVILGLHRAVTSLPAPAMVVAVVCIAIVAVAFSAAGLKTQHQIRAEAAGTVQGTLSFAAASSTPAEPGERRPRGVVAAAGPATGAVSAVQRPLVVFANLRPGGNSRWFWQRDHAVDVLTTVGLERVDRALKSTHGSGRSRLVVATDATSAEFHSHAAATLEDLGWSILDTSKSPAGHTNLYLVGSRIG